MLWFRAPEKVYFKKGCMPVALDELGTVMGKKKCFIVTDTFLYKNGYVKPIEENWIRWESSDGGRFLHGWYGICQCVPGRMPFHGA